MIEINLLPGSAGRAKRRRGPALKLGKLPGIPALPKIDRPLLLTAAAWIVGIGGLVFLFFGARAQKSELRAQIDAERADSIRLQGVIKDIERQKDRQDTLSAKIAVVQKIDATRYIWAHIIDESARALPEFIWLVSVTPIPPDTASEFPRFELAGRAGNNFALTAYLQRLEESPFLRAVKLKKSELLREDEKLVYSFIVEAGYEEPPPDVIETVPLFAGAEADSVPPDTAAARPAAPPGRGTGAAGTPATQPAGRGAATPPRRPGTQQEPR